MLSLKLLIVFLSVLAVCYCDSRKKKHKYELYWHGFHYLIFLAFKFKALLVLGFIFTIGVLAGKFFAIIKFVEYMKKTPHDDHHSEKIIYMPHGSADYPPIQSFSQPSPAFGKPYSGGGGSHHDSYPPGFAVDQPPPGAEIDGGGGGHFNGPGQGPGPGPEGNYGYGQQHGYGRSSSSDNYSISDYFKLFRQMIKKFDITDLAFNDLKLKSDLCRRKFVCEADFSGKDNLILKSAFRMFSDDNYLRYKTRENITSLEECSKLYTNCTEVT